MTQPKDAAAAIGVWRGVEISVTPHDAVTADVSLAIAGMFAREMSDAGPAGGLKHLDMALGGAMTRLRSDGIFRAALGELLVLSAPSPPIRAESVLAVGLGDPTQWTPDAMREAVTAAACETLRIKAPSAAFAPSLLDSGLQPASLYGTSGAMLSGLFHALTLRTLGPPVLSRWMFCAGSAHFEDTVDAFRLDFARLIAG